MFHVFSGREQWSIFSTLPSKKKFPDYYVVIARPISFHCIQERLKKSSSESGYAHLADLIQDYHLIFENAKTYNEPGSIVYEDADALEASLPSPPLPSPIQHPYMTRQMARMLYLLHRPLIERIECSVEKAKSSVRAQANFDQDFTCFTPHTALVDDQVALASTGF